VTVRDLDDHQLHAALVEARDLGQDATALVNEWMRRWGTLVGLPVGTFHTVGELQLRTFQ
jgi:hypothetical protein